jgi:hypothetical protein
VFGRRTKSADSVVADEETTATGKGRPTPTRKEAEAARKQRIATPKTRKEQAASRREATREARARRQVALNTGDDRYLPTRDQGPVKRYVRDWIDSRRTFGELILPTFIVVFILSLTVKAFAVAGIFVWFVVIGVMAADSVRVGRGATRAVAAKFGSDKTKGVAMYAVMRGWQMRRLRLPKPQVKSGDQI